MKKVMILAALLALSGCANKSGAQKALQGAGYTNVKLTGYDFTGCAEGDTFHDGFSATGPAGKPVDGVVCSGWLKGSTIRTY